jgi:hypothetical protein
MFILSFYLLFFTSVKSSNLNSSFTSEIKFHSYKSDAYQNALKVEILLRVLLKQINYNKKSPIVFGNLINQAANDVYLKLSKEKLEKSQFNHYHIPAEWLDYMDSYDFRYCGERLELCVQTCPTTFILQIEPYNFWCKLNSIKRKKRFLSISESNQQKMIIDEIVHESLKDNFKPLEIATNGPPCESRGLRRLHNSLICMDFDECDYKTMKFMVCDKNAKCLNKYGSYECKCDDGFYGTGRVGNCFSRDFCSGKFCRKNGQCVFKTNNEGYKCECALKCLNGGRCIVTQNKYECKCSYNTTGLLCEQIVSSNMLDTGFDEIKNKNFISQIMYSFDDGGNKQRENLEIVDNLRNFLHNKLIHTQNEYLPGQAANMDEKSLTNYLVYRIMQDRKPVVLNTKVLDFNEYQLMGLIENYTKIIGKNPLDMIEKTISKTV